MSIFSGIYLSQIRTKFQLRLAISSLILGCISSRVVPLLIEYSYGLNNDTFTYIRLAESLSTYTTEGRLIGDVDLLRNMSKSFSTRYVIYLNSQFFKLGLGEIALSLFWTTLRVALQIRLIVALCKTSENRSMKIFSMYFLVLPSVLIWTSLVGKDVITFIGLCGVLGVYFTDKKFKRFGSIIEVMFWLFLLFKIKAVVATLLVVTWIMAKVVRLNARLKLVTIVLLLFVSYVTGIIDSSKEALLQQSDAFAGLGVQNIDMNALVDFNSGFIDIILSIPEAVGRSFFRPFIWELGSMTQIGLVLGDFVFVLWSLYVLKRSGFHLNIVFTAALALAFVVGVTTLNFGSLVRYRVILWPLLFASTIQTRDLHGRFKNG